MAGENTGTGAAATSEAQGGKGTENAGKPTTGEQGAAAGAAAGDAGGKGGEQGKGAEGTAQSGDKGGESGKGGKSGGEETPAGGAPEKYDFKIPDDAKPFVPKQILERVESVARANGWTNDEANAELAEMLNLDQTIRAAQISTFETETKADEDFGGEQLAETQRLANLAIDKVFPAGHRLRDRFMTNLQRSGYGSEISIVAFLATVGKALAEDTPPRARQAPRGSGKDPAANFYDHPTSQKVQEEAGASKA